MNRSNDLQNDHGFCNGEAETLKKDGGTQTDRILSYFHKVEYI